MAEAASGEWTELPGFPRVLDAKHAPWASAARIVNGQIERKDGAPITLSPAKAFVQNLEAAFLEAWKTTPDVARVVEDVLAAHAKNIDEVSWCRHRGTDLVLSLKVYATRSFVTLFLSLDGPLGRYANTAPPAFPTAKKTKAKPKKEAASTLLVPPVVERLAPPSVPLVLDPLVPECTPSYASALAFDRDGRLFAVVRLPNDEDYHFACIDPSGKVTLTPTTRRDALRTIDSGAMTSALLPEVHASELGLIRIEHYDHAGGLKERLGIGDVWHVTRARNAETIWELGVHRGWFLRLLARGKGKLVLDGVDLASGKGKKATLELGVDVRVTGVALDASEDRALLRLLVAEGVERRIPVRIAKDLFFVEDEASEVEHGVRGHFVAPVPNREAWVMAEGRELRLVTRSAATVLFALDAGFGPETTPWNGPKVKSLGGDAILVTFDFGSDNGPRAVGAVLCDVESSGQPRVRQVLSTDSAGVIGVEPAKLTLETGHHVVGFAGSAEGDLAALVTRRDGLALVWVTDQHAVAT